MKQILIPISISQGFGSSRCHRSMKMEVVFHGKHHHRTTPLSPPSYTTVHRRDQFSSMVLAYSNRHTPFCLPRPCWGCVMLHLNPKNYAQTGMGNHPKTIHKLKHHLET